MPRSPWASYTIEGLESKLRSYRESSRRLGSAFGIRPAGGTYMTLEEAIPLLEAYIKWRKAREPKPETHDIIYNSMTETLTTRRKVNA